MDASDPMQKSADRILQAGGRPHMDCFAAKGRLAMTGLACGADESATAQAKVFWFFFSKKNPSFLLTLGASFLLSR
jgi:hypothetical protein